MGSNKLLKYFGSTGAPSISEEDIVAKIPTLMRGKGNFSSSSVKDFLDKFDMDGRYMRVADDI